MQPIDRRAFLAKSGGAVACLEGLPLARAAFADDPPPAAAQRPPAPPRVALGRTGIEMSRLAMGTGVHGGNRQSNQTRMGFERLVALFRHAYNRGITFFDLADLYGTHVYFREALRTIPRDRITILTKLWWRYDGPTEPVAEGHRRRTALATLERFRHELNTDRLDIVLLHCVEAPAWDRQLVPYMEALTEAKRNRQVRAVGVSCHDLRALNRAAECEWVEVILARINPRGVRMDGRPEEVTAALRRAKENGKAVIGMKIFGEGELVQQRNECMRFAQNLGLLDAMTIGFEAPEQIDDTLTLLARHPAAAIVNGRAGEATPRPARRP
jgi:aryl-alcohol dehydrogenase-like predicted oxidoreductase